MLGILPEAGYEQAKVEVSAGDTLVMYSDGLVEAANSRVEEYGEGRFAPGARHCHRGKRG